ncbi:hypothetical protein FOFC_10647 [Fusarium oxysporum]|nr:hypothetical protein FOFC_10647 [Fusarium oxysporum]
MLSSIPSTQRAAVLRGSYGERHSVESDYPVTLPGPNEVLVHLEAAGICAGDLPPRDGSPPAPPVAIRSLVAGHEGVGYIVSLGHKVTGFQVGDRAAVVNGYVKDGTFQEYLVLPASDLVRIPLSERSASELAPLLCAGGTALAAVRAASISPGAWLCVTGAGGGVGSLAIQYARYLGYRVIAVDSIKKRAQCESLGAIFIDYEDSETVVGRVRAASNDSVDATLVCSPSAQSYTIHVGHLMGRGLQLKGQSNAKKRDIEDALALANQGIVPSVEIVELASLDNALDKLKKGQATCRQFVPSQTEATFPLYNPATEQHVADIHQAGSADIDAAVAAAEQAFPAWRDTPINKKSPLFGKLARLILRDADELWNLERLAMGRLVRGNKYRRIGAKLFLVLKLGKLIKEAGFPPGVVNIVTGPGPKAGSYIAHHMKIRKIAFTGSTITGKKILAASANSNLKKVTLELGGKSPAIIFEDADLEKAVYSVEFSIHHNSGQHCQANSRVFVQRKIAKAFTERLVELLKSRKMGDPEDKSVFQGPQGDRAQRDRILTILEKGLGDGKLICGGKASSIDNRGFFIEPTVITDVPDNSILMTEEIFGPVVIVNTFDTDEEALFRANNTEYGLYSSIYTRDVERALKFAKFLEAGAVGLNCSAPTQAMDMPVGGWKQSGIGREMHMYALENYLETKV